MPHYSDHINILLIPTNACNMNCVYCFHNPYTEHYDKMSISTVKHLLDITTPYYKKINLIWHGGEPLLMGMDFYKEVIELEKTYSSNISNSIQSNLTLLTPEFADFLVENNISVSGSFDGTCNDSLRGNSEKILSGRQLIIDRKKNCGFIMVVSNKNIEHLIESYNFFKNIETNFSLNLYLDQKDNSDAGLKLEKAVAVDKLCELFDFWATDTTGKIHISYFRNILDYILFKKKSVCSYTSCMGRWLCVKSDGAITPCNRYFPPEYGYGNIYDYNDIGDAFVSPGFEKLLKDAITRRDKCKSCVIYDYCTGGCNNVALNENGVSNNGGLNCQILVAVYEHIASFVESALRDKSRCYNPLLVKLMSEYTRSVE